MFSIRRLAHFLGGMTLVCGAAYADPIDDAAQYFHVNADVLRAMAYYESRLNPNAQSHNANGTVDIGLMQINSVHFPTLRRYGIDEMRLKDARINARVGAALLYQHTMQYGATWRAVGAYHSRTPALGQQYARAVYDIYMRRAWETQRLGKPLTRARFNAPSPQVVAASQLSVPAPGLRVQEIPW